MDRLSCILLMLLSAASYAEDAQISFTPLTPVAFTMTRENVAVVNYSVRNNTKSTKKLNVVTMKGMKSLKGRGNCGAGMVLLPKTQCNLSLQLNGGEMMSNIKGMPMLCEPDMSSCYLPDPDDQMDIIIKD